MQFVRRDNILLEEVDVGGKVMSYSPRIENIDELSHTKWSVKPIVRSNEQVRMLHLPQLYVAIGPKQRVDDDAASTTHFAHEEEFVDEILEEVTGGFRWTMS